MLDAAAIPVEGSVKLKHRRASGTLMQTIDILSDERDSRQQTLKGCYRQVGGVGARRRQQRSSPLVPIPDELRIPLEGFGGCKVFGPVAGPQTRLGLPKGRHATFRGNASSRQEDRVPRCRQGISDSLWQLEHPLSLPTVLVPADAAHS